MSAKFSANLVSVSAKTKVSDTDFLLEFFENVGCYYFPMRPDGCYVPLRVGHFERYNTQPTFSEDATYAILKGGYVRFLDNECHRYKLKLSDLVSAMSVMPFLDGKTFYSLYWKGEKADAIDYFRLLQVALFNEIRYEI